jgi:hypothetical protein
MNACLFVIGPFNGINILYIDSFSRSNKDKNALNVVISENNKNSTKVHD